jgi:hypothetical protein
MLKKLLFFILVLAFTPLQTVVAETLTFTTYYPAPFGAYDRLRLVPRDPSGMVCNAASLGTLFVENLTNTLKICSNPDDPGYQLLNGIWRQNGDKLFPYYTAVNPNIKVGIGTTNPQTRLDVDGFTYIGPRDPEESLWLSPGLVVHGDVHVGAERKTANSEPAGNGPRLIFTGGPSVAPSLESTNTDYLWINRYNVARDVSELRITIGDNPLPYNIYRDSLVIGAINLDMPFAPLDIDGTFYPAASWAPRFRMTSDGRLGINTADALPRTTLELGDDGAILARGTYQAGWIEPNLGAGTRMLWYPRKAAFRAGTVSGTQWNQANTGAVSFATGYNTIASGDYSTAMGESTTAQALGSVVIGRWNIISGDTDAWLANDPLFVIGNGTSAAARSNALTVLKDGKVGIGTVKPLSYLHVNNAGDNIPLGNDNGVEGALTGEIMLTGNNPGLNLIGQDDSAFNGQIKLTDVHKTTGNVNDMWTILRSTYTRDSDLRIVYVSRNDPEKRYYVALPAVTLKKTGKIGIGVTDPSHILHINGAGRSTQAAWDTSSDGRVKTDVTPLRGSLEDILRLNPVSFRWAPEYRAARPELPEADISFIAQEVEAVFPDMVRTTSETFGETTLEDFRVLNTSALVPRLVAALKEQQQMIDEQRRMINDLKGRVAELEKGQKL